MATTQPGYTLPNSSDPSGVKQNFASPNNPPKPPANAPNSSPITQENGPSLPKQAQGVLAKTTTDINNLFPVAGCPIKLPALFQKLQTKFTLFPQVEGNRLKEWGTKLGEFLAPIVEVIDQAIKTIKKFVKELKEYIDKILEIVKEIQEWITLVTDFIQFALSLPARLAQLIANCLASLVNGLKTMAGNFVSGLASAATANTSFATNSNSGNYAKPPAVPTT